MSVLCNVDELLSISYRAARAVRFLGILYTNTRILAYKDIHFKDYI